jgi:hypothetical protein
LGYSRTPTLKNQPSHAHKHKFLKKKKKEEEEEDTQIILSEQSLQQLPKPLLEMLYNFLRQPGGRRPKIAARSSSA